MDLIERFFGISPDRGNGMLEATLLVVVLLIPIAIKVFRARRQDCVATVAND